MQKIKKNLSAIQHKFQSLKVAQKQYHQPMPIGQVAEIMTYGVVSQKQVGQFLQHIHSSQQLQSANKFNENWTQLSIQEMILFLDKVIKYRNVNKPKEERIKQRLNIGLVKKKVKRTNNAHQNPYIPPKVQGGQVTEGESGVQGINQGQGNKEPQVQPQPQQSPYQSSQQAQQEPTPTFGQTNDLSSLPQQLSQQIRIQAQNLDKNSGLDLPQDFKSYPVQQRYLMLLDKYTQDKKTIQKKLTTIYAQYRRQMYVPHESFQINKELLMDLRIFLKYFKEFDLGKRFKPKSATCEFKKVANNGIWLSDEKFIDLHYRMIQILMTNDQQLNRRLENGQINDKKKANQLKKELSKTAKLLMQNILKLKQLAELITDQKISKLLNDNSGKKIIKKIVQVHSGLIKEDVLLRLQERVSQKKKKQFLPTSSQRIKTQSPQNQSSLSPTRTSPHKLTIYQTLQIPTFGQKQMKNSSVYSALELLNMHKQKQKLKKLINQTQNEQYLEAYFKKEKQLTSLMRSGSIKSVNYNTLNIENSIKTSRLKQSVENKPFESRHSISLPRMKFT